MTPEIAPPLDTPSPSRCAATAKTGEKCKGYAIKGSPYCAGHSMSPEDMAERRKKAAEVRRERAEAKRATVENSRKGLRVLLGERLEDEAEVLTERLRSLALSTDDAIALRGIELWLSRVYGKAVQPTQDLSPELPQDVEALRAMSPEERRALLYSMSPPTTGP